MTVISAFFVIQWICGVMIGVIGLVAVYIAYKLVMQLLKTRA